MLKPQRENSLVFLPIVYNYGLDACYICRVKGKTLKNLMIKSPSEKRVRTSVRNTNEGLESDVFLCVHTNLSRDFFNLLLVTSFCLKFLKIKQTNVSVFSPRRFLESRFMQVLMIYRVLQRDPEEGLKRIFLDT